MIDLVRLLYSIRELKASKKEGKNKIEAGRTGDSFCGKWLYNAANWK